jgi:hypothetical protein
LCDNRLDFHVLGANKRQFFFGGPCLLENGISCPLLLTFLFFFSFKMPNAVELSVRRGIGDWIWPNSASVTLSGAPLWAF